MAYLLYEANPRRNQNSYHTYRKQRIVQQVLGIGDPFYQDINIPHPGMACTDWTPHHIAELDLRDMTPDPSQY